MMNRIYKETGFTLLEVLVTLIIIGILASIAVPMFLSAKSNADLERSSSDLVRTLYKAQLKAVNEKIPVKIVFSNTAPTNDTAIVHFYPMGTTKLITDADNSLIYMGRGGFITTALNGTYATPRKFVLCNGAVGSATQSKVITVDRIGRIRESKLLGGCKLA